MRRRFWTTIVAILMTTATFAGCGEVQESSVVAKEGIHSETTQEEYSELTLEELKQSYDQLQADYDKLQESYNHLANLPKMVVCIIDSNQSAITLPLYTTIEDAEANYTEVEDHSYGCHFHMVSISMYDEKEVDGLYVISPEGNHNKIDDAENLQEVTTFDYDWNCFGLNTLVICVGNEKYFTTIKVNFIGN